ncbi:MAG TPA: arginine--tRNA ligase [Clostridiaceae bacterium]|nr:arginine--tRNA ligase [Clostridiaceae bacterium]
MINIIDDIKLEIRETIKKAIIKSQENGLLPAVEIPEINIEIPREKEHGEFSSNIAMQITRLVKKPPRQTAEIIINNMELDDSNIAKVECAGPGFMNFYLSRKWLSQTLKNIQKEKEDYGKSDIGKGQKVMVEFVSANPTGPLHMGNARGGALGDCIASVLEASGYKVHREFYINDAGNQIEKFALSLEARYIQLLKGEEAVAFPEDGYHGEDIIEHMKDFIALHGDKYLNVNQEERRKEFVKFALERNLKRIKSDLENYGIKFDTWFSEQSLYDSNEIYDTLDFLRSRGYLMEKDGATWLIGEKLGLEKDEVLVRNNGIPTYFASDIAYHKNKFLIRGFDRVINLWGADHHGHVARMKAAVGALGVDPKKLDIVLFQLVRLYRNGEIVRMSKRTGKAISLGDLLEEVGQDAARFFFNMKAAGSHLDFDLDLAVQQSNENPVYYVQYAHARICSMLKLLLEDGIQVPSAEEVNLELLQEKEEIELIKKLAELPEEVKISAETLEPSRLTRYVMEVSSLFHSFYNACRVRGVEEDLMKARLVLVECTRIVIRNTLDLLKITAPERM